MQGCGFKIGLVVLRALGLAWKVVVSIQKEALQKRCMLLEPSLRYTGLRKP